MKKLCILLIFLTSVSIGCKKEKTPEPIPVPAPIYNSLELAISGKWILDRRDSIYFNGSYQFVTLNYNDPANYYLDLQLTKSQYQLAPRKQGINNTTWCKNPNIGWIIETVAPNILDMRGGTGWCTSYGQYTIISQSSTSLVIQEGTTGGTLYDKFYFHK